LNAARSGIGKPFHIALISGRQKLGQARGNNIWQARRTDMNGIKTCITACLIESNAKFCTFSHCHPL
jgi:hypothetical protein